MNALFTFHFAHCNIEEDYFYSFTQYGFAYAYFYKNIHYVGIIYPTITTFSHTNLTEQNKKLYNEKQNLRFVCVYTRKYYVQTMLCL